MSGQGVVFKNANREAIRIFGYEPEEFWAKKDWDLPSLIAEEDRGPVLKEISSLRQPGDKSPYEYRLLQKDGAPCWIIGSAEVLLDSDGEQIIQSVFLDIDSRKKAEQRSQRLAEQVEASNEILHLALAGHLHLRVLLLPQESPECQIPEHTCQVYGCKAITPTCPQALRWISWKSPTGPRSARCTSASTAARAPRPVSLSAWAGRFWCRVTLSVVHSGLGPGSPSWSSASLEISHARKEMEQALEEARTRDGLTACTARSAGCG